MPHNAPANPNITCVISGYLPGHAHCITSTPTATLNAIKMPARIRPANDKLLKARDAAEFTSLSESTIRRLAWQRKIRSFKVRGTLRFKQSDMEALIIERPPIEEEVT